MLSRQKYDVSTDTGVWTDTGPAFSGGVVQMRWEPVTGDTGGDLQISLLSELGADTGNGIIVYDDNDCLGADFMKVPMQPAHGPDGSDTGVDDYAPIVAAGDRLRVKVTPGGAAVVGRLYIWTYSG
jgi:hypothetical protein